MGDIGDGAMAASSSEEPSESESNEMAEFFDSGRVIYLNKFLLKGFPWLRYACPQMCFSCHYSSSRANILFSLSFVTQFTSNTTPHRLTHSNKQNQNVIFCETTQKKLL